MSLFKPKLHDEILFELNKLTTKQKTNIFLDAAYLGLDNIVEIMIILKCIDINAKDKYNNTALSWAILNNKIKVVKVLLKYGAYINLTTGNGYNALACAYQQNNNEMINLLEKCCSNQNQKKK